jgi:hydroxyacylglutathione hydrolase
VPKPWHIDCQKSSTDVKVDEGDLIRVGTVPVRVLHTLGYSDDSFCLLVDGKKLLTGDTLMVGSVGAIGMAGGDQKNFRRSHKTPELG